MVMPGPAERWYMEQAEDRCRIEGQVSNTPEIQAACRTDKLEIWGVSMPLQAMHWEHEKDTVPVKTTVDIDIDTSASIGLVLSLATECETLGTTDMGLNGTSVLSGALDWHLDDTVDGKTWAALSSGGLFPFPGYSSRVIRITEVLGSRVRLRLVPYCVRTDFTTNGTFARRDVATPDRPNAVLVRHFKAAMLVKGPAK